MQIILDSKQIRHAPDDVRIWLAGHIGLYAIEDGPDLAEQVNDDQPVSEPTPEIKEVLSRAKELIDSKGEDALSAILKKLGVDRVSECPEDKRAALLAEIAVHA